MGITHPILTELWVTRFWSEPLTRLQGRTPPFTAVCLFQKARGSLEMPLAWMPLGPEIQHACFQPMLECEEMVNSLTKSGAISRWWFCPKDAKMKPAGICCDQGLGSDWTARAHWKSATCQLPTVPCKGLPGAGYCAQEQRLGPCRAGRVLQGSALRCLNYLLLCSWWTLPSGRWPNIPSLRVFSSRSASIFCH